MAAKAGSAYIDVRGDFSPFDKQLGRLSVTSRARFAKVGKAAAIGFGAGVAAAGFAAKKAFTEFQEAEKATAQTSAALKSTGRAAGVTAKQIEQLANAISLKAGIDDEAIQSSENLLLTFTKVRNETGRGNDIFNQATQSIVDMSVAMDQDLKSSAVQIGKALNDPIKGMTALQRVGVAFTEKQKERVTGWVEEGDALRAQKFILKELTKEFGGSAAAQATSTEKMTVAIDNLFESFGKMFGPAIEDAAQAVANFVNQIQTGEGAGGAFADRMRQVGDAVSSAFGVAKRAVETAIEAISGYLRDNRKDIMQARDAFVNIGEILAGAFRVVLAVARRVFPGVRQVVQGVLRGIGGYVKIFTGLFTGDFRKMWEGVKQVFSGGLKFVGGLIRAATAPMREAAARVGRGILNAFKAAFELAKKVVGDALAFMIRRFASFVRNTVGQLPIVGGKFRDLADKIDGAADRVDRLGEKADKSKDDIADLADQINNLKGKKIDLSVTLDFATKAFDLGLTGGGRAIHPDMVQNVVTEKAQAFAQDNIGSILGNFGGGLGGGALGPIASRFGLGLTSGFRPGDSDSWHGVGRAWDYAGAPAAMLAFAKFLAATLGPRLLELIHTPLGFSIDNGVRTAPFAQADHYDHVHVALQRGGVIPGQRTGDRVPAMLEEGEGIINRRAVAAMGGRRAIDAINRGIPRFQKGGIASLNQTFPAHSLADAQRNPDGYKFIKFDAIRRIFEAVGASPREAYMFATIARGESGGGRRGGYPGIVASDRGIGLVQNTAWTWDKNSTTYKLWKNLGGETGQRNPFNNARVALELLRDSGWGNWHGTSYLQDPGSGVGSALTKGDREYRASGFELPGGSASPGKGTKKRPPGLQRTGPGHGTFRRGGFGDQFRQRGGPKNRDTFRQHFMGADKISEKFRLPLALAALTDDQGADDLALLKLQEGELAHSLQVAASQGKTTQAAELAEALGSTRDAIESLTQATEENTLALERKDIEIELLRRRLAREGVATRQLEEFTRTAAIRASRSLAGGRGVAA
jgi:hypothetical protein